jgi:hypothetical protein
MSNLKCVAFFSAAAAIFVFTSDASAQLFGCRARCCARQPCCPQSCCPIPCFQEGPNCHGTPLDIGWQSVEVPPFPTRNACMDGCDKLYMPNTNCRRMCYEYCQCRANGGSESECIKCLPTSETPCYVETRKCYPRPFFRFRRDCCCY